MRGRLAVAIAVAVRGHELTTRHPGLPPSAPLFPGWAPTGSRLGILG